MTPPTGLERFLLSTCALTLRARVGTSMIRSTVLSRAYALQPPTAATLRIEFRAYMSQVLQLSGHKTITWIFWIVGLRPFFVTQPPAVNEKRSFVTSPLA